MPWNEEVRATWARHDRLAASPGTFELMQPLVAAMDVQAVLPTVRVPTLVVQHADDPFIPPAYGKYVADHIPGAKYVELPGRHASPRGTVARFVPGDRRVHNRHQTEVADDRVLATVLFTDIVDSTRRAAEIGDRDWHALLDAHDAVVRAQLARFRGREVSTSGTVSLRCSTASASDPLRDGNPRRGAGARHPGACRLHTGECEVRGDDIGGIAVHIGARVSASAGANDVLVSSTLRDLVIGSGLEFDERGTHQLKGVPGEWHLSAVTST